MICDERNNSPPPTSKFSFVRRKFFFVIKLNGILRIPNKPMGIGNFLSTKFYVYIYLKAIRGPWKTKRLEIEKNCGGKDTWKRFHPEEVFSYGNSFRQQFIVDVSCRLFSGSSQVNPWKGHPAVIF